MIIPPGIGGNLKCEKINYTQYSSTDKWGGGWSDLASVLIMSTLGLCKKDKSRLEESLTLKVALRVILSTQLSVCL